MFSAGFPTGVQGLQPHLTQRTCFPLPSTGQATRPPGGSTAHLVLPKSSTRHPLLQTLSASGARLNRARPGCNLTRIATRRPHGKRGSCGKPAITGAGSRHKSLIPWWNRCGPNWLLEADIWRDRVCGCGDAQIFAVFGQLVMVKSGRKLCLQTIENNKDRCNSQGGILDQKEAPGGEGGGGALCGGGLSRFGLEMIIAVWARNGGC